MRRLIATGLLRVLAALLPAAPVAGSCHAQSVLAYHGGADRSGAYAAPALTWERARHIRLDRGFAPHFSGHLYAQPLYWQPPGGSAGELIVATESDTVQAIDAQSGGVRWVRTLGRPVALADQPCGNIDPLGVTGTPVIDPKTQAVYLDAMVAEGDGPHHKIFALSLTDGATLPGWPVDVATALAGQGPHFNASDQNQRGALTTLGGRVYVPYGGHFGDCGDYRGWVVGIDLEDPHKVVSWHTRAPGGGIWAPGGIAGDGRSLFVATGNTIDTPAWGDGEAVFRLVPDLRRDDRKQDFFAPTDWHALDRRDADLGGTNPMLLNLPEGNGAQALVLALGKDGRAYLLDRDDLGGLGGGLVAETVSTGPIRTAPAVYPAADGVFVAFQASGAQCGKSARRGGLTVLKIRGGSPPSLATAWCAAPSGAGAPIVTTTDGRADPIVWIVGAEGDNRLHGYRGDTGETLFDGGAPAMQ